MIAGAESPTRQFAKFSAALRYEHLGPEERHACARHLVDTAGACVAGATSNVSIIAAGLAREIGGSGDIPVPGRRDMHDRLMAAWLCGAAAHGLEVDDGYRAGSVHPGCVVVPALLTASAGSEADGRRLMAALAVGYEVSTRLAEAIHPASRDRGFHNTSIVGVFAAACAVGSLRGQDAATIEQAMGIAASSAAGLFAFLEGGGEIKRLHAGFAAREGLLAAMLAGRGMTGPNGVLEVADGFFQAFAGLPVPEALGEGLWPRSAGTALNITRCYIKPYACCRHIHPAIDAVLDVMATESVEADVIAEIRSGTYAIAAKHARGGWGDMASAQLSYQFCVATAMRHGKVTIEAFGAPARSDRQTNAYCELVKVSVDEGCQATYPSLRSARVTVVLKDGRSFERFIDEPSGSARHPLSDQSVVSKFVELASPILGEEPSRAAAETLLGAHLATRAGDLVSCLLPSAAHE
ncbi:MmgE/PrpD family protein [Pontitalea aquivivens]|uniref:MmgE/PrpD family protein n=1 Tax=Pontitalea aquivivens TaxID=3388663 RepID=UPI0039707566